MACAGCRRGGEVGGERDDQGEVAGGDNRTGLGSDPRLIQKLAARGLAWGIVTNKAARFTDPLVAAIPEFATAGAVVSGDTTPHSKPHPEPLLEAARRLKVDPTRCLYVGDDERDIVAGRAAGMLTLAATYGYMGANADATRWQADGQVESPLGVLQWLNVA